MILPRALFFLSDFGGGGAQRTLINLAASMPSEQLNVELAVANAEGPAQQWVPSHLTYHNLHRRRMATAIPALARLIKSRKPDVVLSTMTHANIGAYLAVRLAGSGAAVALRETNSHRAQHELSQIVRKLAGIFYRKADMIVALSDGVRSELVEDMGLNPECTKTIPNPVEVSVIKQRVKEARKMPSPWPGGKRRPRILGIGRLVRQKAFEVLLDAVSTHAPEADIVLLGEGPDRPMLEALYEGPGRLVMPGFVEDASPYLAHADLFVLSSRWEGFGHVIVEAMAAGLPVISTDCPYGPTDILTHEKTGLLIANEDADALGQAIRRLLDNPAFCRGIAVNGRKAALRFESKNVARQYADILLDAIDRRLAKQARI